MFFFRVMGDCCPSPITEKIRTTETVARVPSKINLVCIELLCRSKCIIQEKRICCPSAIITERNEESLEKSTNKWYRCPVNLLANLKVKIMVNVMHCAVLQTIFFSETGENVVIDHHGT